MKYLAIYNKFIGKFFPFIEYSSEKLFFFFVEISWFKFVEIGLSWRCGNSHKKMAKFLKNLNLLENKIS